MGHSYGLLTSWDIPIVHLLHGTFLWFNNFMVHFLWFINFMGHSYGLFTSWDIPMVINFMGHSYGLLTSWDIPMVH